MSSRALLPALIALCAGATCFSPEYHCRIICSPTQGCPDKTFYCDTNAGLCSLAGRSCTAAPSDAGTEPEAPLPDAPTADTAPPPDTAEPGGQAPEELCYAGNCITLSQEMRQALVLWLDPSNLPADGLSVSRWPDRSGHGNDALAISSEAIPRSRGDGLRMIQQAGGSMRLTHDPSLDFGAQDFALFIVATVQSAPPACLFRKLAGDRSAPRGVEVEWGFSVPLAAAAPSATVNATPILSTRAGLADEQPHLFVLRRTGGAVELRLDGQPEVFATLAPAEQSTSNEEHAYLGGCGTTAFPLPALHAVVAVRGALPLADLTRTEGFLLQAFPRR